MRWQDMKFCGTHLLGLLLVRFLCALPWGAGTSDERGIGGRA